MGYNERRGSHVSEFITNLNAIPSTQETASQEQGNFNLDDDQPLFTNTDFLDFVDLDDFDFDIGQEADLQPANFDSNCPSPVAGDVDATNKGLNFIQGELNLFSHVFASGFYMSLLLHQTRG
jgi:hypothetical protein